MKNSDVIKALLFKAVNEIAADPTKYAVNPGKYIVQEIWAGCDVITIVL